MFGIGAQELLIIGLLCLVIFGPSKLPSMARDFGRFVNGAHRTVEEFKGELLTEEVTEVRHAVEEIKDETRRSVEDLETGVAFDEGQDGHVGEPPSDEKEEARELK